ncbi:hypothetical protein [Streptomyces sp. NBC_01237]|uniref:hypothetical protein n=1 Tax=Streptomyces sp. NBC_01237 TaxID=2903790 RepID=UPI002DDBCDB3|nr:hypothetical protein [Streptomyces sp. NBC_01237]WRZ77159.1 hypothetical protein OG251_36425 [Streptomyces sp. NBC_01237]WRZ78463.1 hypothetical protein OG251_43295 [Streptomyces sp. NBC_01237]
MDESPQPQDQQTENQVSGQAHVYGPVIQARDVHGNVTVVTGRTPQPEVPLHVTVELLSSSSLLMSLDAEPARRWQPKNGVRLLVEAHTAQAVVLQRMRPVILSRRPPRPARSEVTRGVLSTRGFTTDLDAEAPALKPKTNEAADFPFTVTNSDPELFVIYPLSAFEVDWRLELDWMSAGRSGTAVIDQAGQPFSFVPVPEPIPMTASEIRAEVYRRQTESQRTKYFRE